MRQASALLSCSQQWLSCARLPWQQQIHDGLAAYVSCRRLTGLAREEFKSSCLDEGAAGLVHCTEALSSSDGPGLRYVVYLASRGHDSEGFCITTKEQCGNSRRYVTPTCIVDDIRRFLPFLLPNGGGVTCSGVNPLQQADFCTSLFQKSHDLKISTCLHTPPPVEAGSAYEHVLQHTDSVILQINNLPMRSIIPQTSLHSSNLANFTDQLKAHCVPYHIRYLLVPGITDQPSEIRDLLEFSKEQGPLLKGIQVMPYHQLGGEKWEALGLSRTLRGLKPFKVEEAVQLVKAFDQQGIHASLAA